MIAPTTQNLVIFDKVVKLTPGRPGTVIFGGVSVVLPTDRVLVVLGRQETGRSTLLRLLGGFERPDAGYILTKTKFSVILNASGYLHPGMTGIENVVMLARMHSMDENIMTTLAVEIPGVDAAAWYLPVGDLINKTRKAMEIVLAALLPYDCYLLDDVERVDAQVLISVMKLLAARKAGVIFTTYNLKFARQYADCACVLARRDLYFFDSIKEAEKFYDR